MHRILRNKKDLLDQGSNFGTKFFDFCDAALFQCNSEMALLLQF